MIIPLKPVFLYIQKIQVYINISLQIYRNFHRLKHAQPIPSDDVPDMQRQTILSIGIHLENPASAPSNLCPQLPYRSRIEMIPKLIHIQKQLAVHIFPQRKRRSVSEPPCFQFTPKESQTVSGMPYIPNRYSKLVKISGKNVPKYQHPQ